MGRICDRIAPGLAFVRLTSNPKIVGSNISPGQAAEALATMAAQSTHEYWVLSFATAAGLASHIELVGAPATMAREPVARYNVKRAKA